MSKFQKFLLRKVDVKDYSSVEISIDEIVGGETLLWVCDSETGECIEVFVIPVEIEEMIRRHAKIDQLLDNAPMPTNREIYFLVKEYYWDFDEIYYSMLYANCK